MSSKIERTIVHSSAVLRYFPRKHIDAPTIGLLSQSIPVRSSKTDQRNPIINLLDCYLGLTGQSLTYLSLSKNATNNLFAGFIGALSSKNFVGASKITRGFYVAGFSKALKVMSVDVPNLTSGFDLNVCLSLWREIRIDPVQREYYQGWCIAGKSGKQKANLRLAWAWWAFGPKPVKAIHTAATAFAARHETKSCNNYVPVFHDLLVFMESNFPDITKANLSDSGFTTNLVEGFCRGFFEQKVERNNCLETTIKRWNDALPFLEATLLDSGVFAKPYRNLPYIEPRRKTGAESKISVKKDGSLVKDKLIVEVPLNLTDDEVIELLFKKIDWDMRLILDWAHREANSIVRRFEENDGEFDHMDFDLDSTLIKAKYRTTYRRQARTGDIAYRLGLPTSYSLEPFIYLLIKEHPEITESFLLSLKLYDKHGKLVGIETTDALTCLVGYKRRRGGDKALQRVALSEKAIIFVDQVLKLTEPLRKYLKAKNDSNYKYLLLSCRTGFCYPAPLSESLHITSRAAFEARLNQFDRCGGSDQKMAVVELVKRLTPTRFRATVGLQVFLDTGSAKAMSEALGHAKYKPDLLSHYLPEPILAFFQSRWIRIFQKGIVCEAMKDSPQLLRASNFKSMDDLDRFLVNHALNLPDDPDEPDEKQSSNVRDVCISVDENILSALLSLESAVSAADQQLVSAKAKYWSKFTSLIQVEIEKNTYDPDMTFALQNARKNVDPNLMQGLICGSNVYQGKGV